MIEIEVVPDPEELGPRAAHVVAAAARDAVAARGRCTVALSGGTTPAAMVAALADVDLPWPRLDVFQVDERFAPDGSPARNLGLLERLVRPGPLDASHIHPMPVTGRDPRSAADRYERTLREQISDPVVLDLVHLGLGSDGHTASLVPGDAALEVVDRDVAGAGLYQGYRRLTMTLPLINRARRRLWLVAGEDKAEAVAALVRGDASIPAGRVARHDALLLLDTAAAGRLRGTAGI